MMAQNKRLFSLEELVEKFDLNRVHKAGAKFDPEKNKWFNHQYLYNREKANFVSDFWNLCDYYFIAPKSYDIKTAAKVFKDDTKNLLESFTKNIHNVDFGNTASIFDEVNKWLNLNNLTFGNVAQPIRLALVGELKGSDLYVIMQILGKEETIKRLEKAIASL
jgi:glutamyl/glutaminyl-tRNA synthetase